MKWKANTSVVNTSETNTEDVHRGEEEKERTNKTEVEMLAEVLYLQVASLLELPQGKGRDIKMTDLIFPQA